MTEQEARKSLAQMGDKQLGNFGEAIWSHILRASGLGYIPLCKIETGRAPVIEGASPIVLPDFEVIAEGMVIYLESKAKTRSVLWRRSKQERHGVDRRNWEAYMRAAAVTAKPCGIGVVELFREQTPHSFEWSGSLLIETLRNLGTPTPGMAPQEHMVYWPRKRFVDLDSWDAMELLEIARGNRPARYPVEITGVFKSIPARQLEMF